MAAARAASRYRILDPATSFEGERQKDRLEGRREKVFRRNPIARAESNLAHDCDTTPKSCVRVLRIRGIASGTPDARDRRAFLTGGNAISRFDDRDDYSRVKISKVASRIARVGEIHLMTRCVSRLSFRPRSLL